jgi:hypothetical protein
METVTIEFLPNPERKIFAIQLLRLFTRTRGMQLGLREAKYAVDVALERGQYLHVRDFPRVALPLAREVARTSPGSLTPLGLVPIDTSAVVV